MHTGKCSDGWSGFVKFSSSCMSNWPLYFLMWNTGSIGKEEVDEEVEQNNSLEAIDRKKIDMELTVLPYRSQRDRC